MEVSGLLAQLPKENKECLNIVLGILHKVSQCAEEASRMPAKHLAVPFAAIFFKADMASLLAGLENQHHRDQTQSATQFLIEHASALSKLLIA